MSASSSSGDSSVGIEARVLQEGARVFGTMDGRRLNFGLLESDLGQLPSVLGLRQRAGHTADSWFSWDSCDDLPKVHEDHEATPTGHVTPVPPRPQYPCGFLARYCW